MFLKRLSKGVLGWLGRPRLLSAHSSETAARGPQCHVIILDGTMSTLEPGHETHAGMVYRLCKEMGPRVSVYYEAGVQWTAWNKTADVMVGRGINKKIRRAYGYLASRYRPGDKIFLLGYSRGAYAARSLAGVLGSVGLLRQDHATVRNIRTAYRHYQMGSGADVRQAFTRAYCHDHTTVEMLGIWDTVKALGLRVPLLWRWADKRHAFHDHSLGPHVKAGFHALALDETRDVYAPVLWNSSDSIEGQIEQVWFRGSHGDVGGQLGGCEASRPLANISLVWMLERAEMSGLPLPRDWRMRFPVDADAPSVGTWSGWGKIFLLRSRRRVGQDSSEKIHPSAHQGQKPGRFATWLSVFMRHTPH
ncbi:MAG: hypothetical protein BM562_05560 [Alphaproteobacteria bacterium MedPE-SWcel]|nr:MAG: hypothetical protein BM562_05560 [Alphaproteobacteria bacterium MedPE-SWcel]